MSQIGHSQPASFRRPLSWLDSAAIAKRARSAAPALLFGLRLWAAVCLALFVAYSLELENASWAGTSAALASLPSLGASQRKSSFLMVGTVVGAVVIVILTSFFSQDREGFLLSLALWGAVCAFGATVLRNFSSYGAALAGYTAVLIASDALGATGGVNDNVFMLAVARASEICIGIICAGVVLAGTDFGGARRRLTLQFASLAAEIAGRFIKTFSLMRSDQAETRSVRRELAKRVVALGPLIDEATGESYDLRYRLRGLQTGVGGLFAALSGWRTVANSMERLPPDRCRSEGEIVLQTLPPDLQSAPEPVNASSWMAEPSRRRGEYRAAVRALLALPADTPSLRLLADATAEALLGLSRALDGITLLLDPGRKVARGPIFQLHLPDLLPAFVAAARAFVTIAAAELFWIATAWPGGAQAVTFAAIGVLLLAPRAEKSYAAVKSFVLALVALAMAAGIVNFAALPAVTTFWGFCIVIGCVLVPFAALSTRSRYAPVFAPMTSFFIIILAPANLMTYDTIGFYNSTFAIVAGMGMAALGFLLIPPPSPSLQIRRIMAFALRDLRRLAAGQSPPLAADWESRLYSRLTALPAQAEPLQLAQAVATLSLGTEIVRLRRIARRLDLSAELDAALDAVSKGNSAIAKERFVGIDQRLAGLPITGKKGLARLRARGSIRAISEALAQHRDYFDSRALR